MAGRNGSRREREQAGKTDWALGKIQGARDVAQLDGLVRWALKECGFAARGAVEAAAAERRAELDAYEASESANEGALERGGM